MFFLPVLAIVVETAAAVDVGVMAGGGITTVLNVAALETGKELVEGTLTSSPGWTGMPS